MVGVQKDIDISMFFLCAKAGRLSIFTSQLTCGEKAGITV